MMWITTPRAAYFDQVHNGVYIRMAIILALLASLIQLPGKRCRKHDINPLPPRVGYRRDRSLPGSLILILL